MTFFLCRPDLCVVAVLFSLFILCVFFIQSDIAALYIKVGLKNIGTVFLHTDAQIPDERFLVLINDMLASGLSFFYSNFIY